MDEAIDKAKEAIEQWLGLVIEYGGVIPEPRSIAEHQIAPEFAGGTWVVVSIDLIKLS